MSSVVVDSSLEMNFKILAYGAGDSEVWFLLWILVGRRLLAEDRRASFWRDSEILVDS
jgi:hypothetical protein